MGSLRDNLDLVFAPLTLIGITRVYAVLDQPEGFRIESLRSPEVHIPFICALFNLAVAMLAEKANKSYFEKRPTEKDSSVVEFLAYGSIACMAVMFLFAVRLDGFAKWLGAYAALCLVNAAWNARAVQSGRKLPHVAVNIGLGLILYLLILIPSHPLQHLPTVYVVLVTIMIAKFFQRWQHPQFPRS